MMVTVLPAIFVLMFVPTVSSDCTQWCDCARKVEAKVGTPLANKWHQFKFANPNMTCYFAFKQDEPGKKFIECMAKKMSESCPCYATLAEDYTTEEYAKIKEKYETVDKCTEERTNEAKKDDKIIYSFKELDLCLANHAPISREEANAMGAECKTRANAGSEIVLTNVVVSAIVNSIFEQEDKSFEGSDLEKKFQ